MWLQLGLCKPVPESTRPTGVDLPAPPLQPTNGAMSMSETRREFRLRCGAVIKAANPEPKPHRTNPCFKCLELWIRHRFTEILSLKKEYKPINGIHRVACRRSSSSSSSSFYSALVWPFITLVISSFYCLLKRLVLF